MTAAAGTSLVLGGIGSGKTTALEAVRKTLRANGTTMLARVPRAGEAPDAAIVIDDAQLLSPAELDALTELAGDPARTVVVSAEPLAHEPALNALTTMLSRQHPPIQLAPMTPREIHEALARAGVPGAQVPGLIAGTGGIPLLVYSALSALASGGDPVRAASVALSERLRRLDEHLLDTLLLCSLSPELGPDDIAAALHLPQLTPQQIATIRQQALALFRQSRDLKGEADALTALASAEFAVVGSRRVYEHLQAAQSRYRDWWESIGRVRFSRAASNSWRVFSSPCCSGSNCSVGPPAVAGCCTCLCWSRWRSATSALKASKMSSSGEGGACGAGGCACSGSAWRPCMIAVRTLRRSCIVARSAATAASRSAILRSSSCRFFRSFRLDA